MNNLVADRAVQQGMAQAIRLGYRIDLPRIIRRPGTVVLLTLTGNQVDQRDDVAPQDFASTIAAFLEDRPASGDLDHGRWVPDTRLYSRTGVCRYCKSGGPDGDHRRTVCRACDMPQCLYPHECRICYVGYIDGVSYGLYGDERFCGYKCTNDAVAKAPRVKKVCRDHLDRPTRRWAGESVRLGDEITERIAMLGQTSELRDYQRTYWFADGVR